MPVMSDPSSFQQYLESWSAEMRARELRIRQLIGSTHWLTDGNHKEYIVRHFLSRYVPCSVEVTHGFIRTQAGACSNELDILLAHRDTAPPFFSEGGLTIAPPEAALATIEVKSTLNRKTLADVFDRHVHTIDLFLASGIHKFPWHAGIFFSTGDSSTDKIIDLVKEKVCRILSTYQHEAPHPLWSMGIARPPLPTCLIVVDELFFVFRFDSGLPSVTLTCFNAKKLCFGLGMVDLLGHLYSITTASPHATSLEMNQFGIDIPISYSEEFPLRE
jgi:hypothetical protein